MSYDPHMRKTFTFLATALLATTAFAQQDFSKVEVKATKVAGSVYMLTGAGGNIGASVGDDGVVMIDDQYAPLAPKIEAALKSITDRPVRFILNTHWHGDHTGGNEHFGRTAPIIAHENVRRRLASGSQTGRIVPPAPKGALPVVTFDHTLTVHLNGEEVRALHVPHGHTDGDSIIYFTGSNVVHMGDDFFNGFFPFVDIDSGGSVQGVIDAGEKVLATTPNDVKIIPGHGPLADKAALRRYLDTVRRTRDVVDDALDAGRTAEQIKADNLLAEWESWGKGFVNAGRWIDTLVRDAKMKK
jgi:cyclase